MSGFFSARPKPMIRATIPSIRSRLRFFDGFQLSAASVSSDTLLAIHSGPDGRRELTARKARAARGSWLANSCSHSLGRTRRSRIRRFRAASPTAWRSSGRWRSSGCRTDSQFDDPRPNPVVIDCLTRCGLNQSIVNPLHVGPDRGRSRRRPASSGTQKNGSTAKWSSIGKTRTNARGASCRQIEPRRASCLTSPGAASQASHFSRLSQRVSDSTH